MQTDLRSWKVTLEIFLLCTQSNPCLLYTSDAADDRICVDLGGRRIIKKNSKVTFQDLRSVYIKAKS